MSIGGGSSESEGFEDNNEVSSPIGRTNLAHDRRNDDNDEEGGSTSDSERENSMDEIPSESFEQSEGPDDSIAQNVDIDEDVLVEGTDL